MSGAARYARLLSPGRIGSLALRNRIAMAPMGSNLCEPDGTPGDRMLAYFEARARGGAALVIVEVAAIAWPLGAANPNQLGVSDDRFLPGLARLAGRIHAHGAKAALQLQHAGRVATRDIVAGRPLLVPSDPPPMAVDLYRDLAQGDVRAATEDFSRPGAKLHYRVMDAGDVAWVIERFADAAERAKRAGFDAVELHAGHGYVLSAFLSPHYNRRGDAYGGPLENRARLLLETIAAVRARVGAGFPIWMRMDGAELGVPDGITAEDAQCTAELAEAAGLDAVHVSAYADPGSGAAFTVAPLVHEPAGYAALAAGVKRRVRIPVIAVGRLAPDDAEALLARGDADFVAMGRKLLADPDLPRKLAAGAEADVRPCIYAYRCVGNVFLARGVRCAVNASTGREHEVPVETPRAARAERVVVVGGGPAGLEAARVAAEAGHAVVLCERDARLGGAAALAGFVDAPIAELVAWLERRVRALGVDVRLGAPVDADAIARLAPDRVVVATGARRERPAVPGADAAHVLDLAAIERALRAGALAGRRVAVWGGGPVGLALAVHLAGVGGASAVAVVESAARFGAGLAPPRLWRALDALRGAGAALHSRTTVAAIEPAGLAIADKEGKESLLAADAILLALPGASDPALTDALSARGLRAESAGDCASPGLIDLAQKPSLRAEASMPPSA